MAVLLAGAIAPLFLEREDLVAGEDLGGVLLLALALAAS
jgi:hypothetical protein